MRSLAFAVPLLLGCGSPAENGAEGAGGSGNASWASTGSASGSGLIGTGGTARASGGSASYFSGGTLGDGGAEQGGRIASSGTTAQAGLGGIPSAGPDGHSPYQRECHGETSMCVDVASLRCLGIRVDTGVAGYSCSNPCQTDADCSNVLASSDAAPGCVDFVTQKHCLLICLQQGKSFTCPQGMGCYVYPGSTSGYCLWQ